MRFLVATLVVGAATLFEAPAWACGATPEPRYSVTQVWPQGDATPPNAPLLVELEAEVTTEPAPQLVPTLTLVRLKDGESVEVKRWGAAPHLAWVPRAALQAGADYEARYSSGYEGDPETSWRFSVGAEARPALSLDGALVVSLEPGKDPEYGPTLNDCGTREMTGWLDVTKARVRLPGAQGGFDTRYAEIWLTDETPHSFRTPVKGESEDSHLVSLSTLTSFDHEGRAEDVLFTLPQESAPYHPCFAVQASDARGDTTEAASICLDQAFPLETPTPTAEPAESNPSTSAACSIGSEGRSESGAMVLLALLGLAWRRRRVPNLT